MSIKKKIAVTLLAGLLTGSVVSATPSLVERESINQVALLQSLAQGYLGGTIKVKDIRTVGDTGIGTFEGLNGEMIVLDGTVYQALGDGRVVVADDKVVVPYATVTMFDDDATIDLTNIADKAAFEKALDKAVNEYGKNSFYMVKMHAEFPSILFRSEYGSQPPYPS